MWIRRNIADERRRDMATDEQALELRRLLPDEMAEQVVRGALGGGWRPSGGHVRRAAEGLIGFLGDHFRVMLQAERDGRSTELRLFIKGLPMDNPAKARFIDEGNFCRREALVYDLFEGEGGDDGPAAWRPPAFLCSASLLVMPDIAERGFAGQPHGSTLDLPHALAAAAAVARFHAAFKNLQTRRPDLLQDHAEVLRDRAFCDSPWLRAAARLSATLLRTFAAELAAAVPDLEATLTARYIETCEGAGPAEGSLNVLLHRDLWINNIMFRSEGGEPAAALLLDFQCVRSGPPVFDVMQLLYMSTSPEFRAQHEDDVLRHYYAAFTAALDEATRNRLTVMRYDWEALGAQRERGRQFAILTAACIFPYALMSPSEGGRHFDDPTTFARHCDEDRSPPVLEYARQDPAYLRRLLEVTQEFVQRYVLDRR